MASRIPADIHWRIALKLWRMDVSHQTQFTDNKGKTHKKKQLRRLHLQRGNKVVLTSGTYRNIVILAIFTAKVNYSISSSFAVVSFQTTTKAFFGQILIQLLIGIPKNAAVHQLLLLESNDDRHDWTRKYICFSLLLLQENRNKHGKIKAPVRALLEHRTRGRQLFVKCIFTGSWT